MSGVSILILTLNEETNLAECIDSCAWSDDIVVFDSLSTDRTQEIARARGARVIERRFDNYAAQRNAALNSVAYAHPWVLMVDADERVPEDLAAEVESSVAAADPGTVMFRMRRMDFFLGRWLKRSSGYPTWFGRLVRVGYVRVEREVNEEFVADGAVGRLAAHLHHYPFNKGIAYWYERHNLYSSMEALEKARSRGDRISLPGLFASDPFLRRRTLKQIGYRLPLRPLLMFLYFYVVRLGILDGRAGCYFSLMRAAYELSIDLKVIEAQRRRQGLAV
jgi:glycosyltransferase involved in cell wall biosynthesis